MNKIKLLLVVFFGSAFLAVPAIVYADHGEEVPVRPTKTTASSDRTKIEAEQFRKKNELEQKRAEFEKKRLEAKEKAANNKDEAKTKACENRAESFKKRMKAVSSRSDKRIETFNKISERVQAFIKNKNLIVANYDQLVADITLKKEAALQARDLAKENSELFECGGDNAKTNVAIFKETIAQEHQAFKDYRESIKNLIKAVKQVIEANKEGASNE